MSFQEILSAQQTRIFKYLTLQEIKLKVQTLNKNCRDQCTGYLMWKEMMGVVRSALESKQKPKIQKEPEVAKNKEEEKFMKKKSSKFSKRFTIRGGRTQKPNQWIHPPILLLDELESKTVEELLSFMTQEQRQVMMNQVEAWRVSICDLLRSLHLQNPDDGSIVAEINYWRDMARILEALDLELQAPWVFKIMNILRSEPSKQESEILKDYELEIRKVGKGLKEASWNFKYMKILEGSAIKIENKYSKLMDTQIVISSVLKTIHNIFQNSNFYKEARIVSLLDRVVSSILTKLKIYFDFSRFFIKNKEELEITIEDFDSANRLAQKLAKGMWIREWIGVQNEADQFRQTKTLDFLNFERPGTAMRKTNLNFQPSSASRPPSVFGSTQTSSFQSTQSSFSLSKSVKPLNQSLQKNQDRPIWYERAEKIIRQVDYIGKVLENLEFIASSLHQIRGEWLSISQDLYLACYRELKEFLYFYEAKAPLIDYEPLMVGNKYIFESFMEGYEERFIALRDKYESQRTRHAIQKSGKQKKPALSNPFSKFTEKSEKEAIEEEQQEEEAKQESEQEDLESSGFISISWNVK